MPNSILNRRCAGNPYPMVAAQYVRASSQRLSITDAAQVGLNPGTSDFSFAFWAYPDSLANVMVPLSKGCQSNATAATATGYSTIINTTGSFQVVMSDDATTPRLSVTSATGLFVAGTWAHACCSFTRAGNLVVYINAVSVGTLAIGTRAGAMASTGSFAFGCASTNLSAMTTFMDGRLDTGGLWLRALSADDVTTLYNGGVGLAYRDLTTGMKANLSAWWDVDGTPNDATGVNTLTNTNGVTYTAGKR